MSTHEHKWVYGGIISSENDSNDSNWNKKCVICKQTENIEGEECQHAWGYIGTFDQETWTKTCYLCGESSNMPMIEAVRESSSANDIAK